MRRALGMMQGSFAAALVAVAVCVALQRPDSAHAEIPPSPPGWQLAFGDDFEGPAGTLPSTERWRYSTGTRYLDPNGPPNWGTGEVTHYTDDPANVSLDGAGRLRITPLLDAGTWTSARIETNEQEFKPPPGGVMRIEGMLQIPNPPLGGALGYWPAFWILGSPYRGHHQNWPSVGEVDIMENVNGVGTIWGVLHCGTVNGGPCNEPNGIEGTTPCAACPGTFHRYRFEWDLSGPVGELRWYLNDLEYHSVSEAELPASTWAEITGHAGYFILLNVAMGGGFPNGVYGGTTPTPGTVPGHPMLADYVAVWYWDPEVQNEPPVIESVSADPPTGTAPLEVVFAVHATDPDGDDLSYEWDFGDGSPISSEDAPTHLYTEAGAYEVRVTVSDGRAEATGLTAVTVAPAAEGSPRLELAVSPRLRRIGPNRRRVRYALTVTNTGDAPARRVSLCARAPSRRVRIAAVRCAAPQELSVGATRRRAVPVRVRAAARGRLTRIRIVARGPGLDTLRTKARLRVRRR